MGTHQASRVHTRPVVLDIGGDRGALLIVAPAAWHGAEIEISAAEQPEQRTHQDVAERHCGGRVVFAAVFPSLVAGEYDVWGRDGQRAARVRIVGGEVAQVELVWGSGENGSADAELAHKSSV